MFIPILVNGVLEDHYFSYSLIPVYENGKIGGVYDAFRNMTETVVGAQKLRESEARLKLATEAAQLGVFVWETAQDQASWENDRVYEIFRPDPRRRAGQRKRVSARLSSSGFSCSVSRGGGTNAAGGCVASL